MHVNYGMHLIYFQKESEGSVTLYYEIYIDSLFLMDFVMNFLMLSLANIMLRCTATCPRRISGAACGAGIYCLTFVTPVFALSVRQAIGGIFSLWGMVLITFRCRTLRQIKKIISPMSAAMLFFGGFFFLIKEKMAFIGGDYDGLVSTLLIEVTAYVLGVVVIKKLKRPTQTVCKVILESGNEKLKVDALVDTGNQLIEPISKKPVSVLDENSMKKLFGGEMPQYYRVVPYTSIGKKNGILKCFEVPRILIEFHEEKISYEKVLIACGGEFKTSDSCMILNPRLVNK